MSAKIKKNCPLVPGSPFVTYPNAPVPGTPVIYRCILYGRHITADIMRTTKTAISRQISSARSSRLLCPNLLIEAHRMKDSTGPFYL